MATPTTYSVKLVCDERDLVLEVDGDDQELARVPWPTYLYELEDEPDYVKLADEMTGKTLTALADQEVLPVDAVKVAQAVQRAVEPGGYFDESQVTFEVTLDPRPSRYAAVTGVRTRKELEAYLPANYKVTSDETEPYFDGEFVIEGTDVAGWTLDGYVIPRLQSGLMNAREQFMWAEETGDGENGPSVALWLMDVPQTRENMKLYPTDYAGNADFQAPEDYAGSDSVRVPLGVGDSARVWIDGSVESDGDRRRDVPTIVVELGPATRWLTWNEARALAAALNTVTDVAENG